jgi:hypothetical protein
MDLNIGLAVLVFYILTLIVLGPTFSRKGNTSNRALVKTYHVFAYIVLILSVVSIPLVAVGCATLHRMVGQWSWVLCALVLVLAVLPLVASVLVVAKKDRTVEGRRAILTAVHLHLLVIALLLLLAPIVGVAFFRHMFHQGVVRRRKKHIAKKKK